MARSRRLRRKAGFTLLEAMIVLAVTGLTLGLVFSVTTRSVATAYRLGDRAMGVADRQVATAAYRGAITSFLVPMLTTPATQAGGGLEGDTTDTAFVGDARQVSGEWVANRGGPCGPVGAYGHMTLALVAQGQGTALTCRLDDQPAAVLLTLKARDARFQYSEDGAAWVPAWTIEAGQMLEDSVTDTTFESRRVYVRVVADDGSSDLMEQAATGHPNQSAQAQAIVR